MTVTISGLGRRFQLFGVALVLGALALAIFARPASAAVTGQVTPSSVSGTSGTVDITASGFGTELNVIQVLQCVHGATDSIQCDANTVDPSVSADPSGNYHNPAYVWHTLPSADFPLSNITCDAANACDLLLIQDDYNNFSNPHILIPMTFTDTAASTTVAPTVSQPASTSTTSTTTATGDTTATVATTVPGETTTAATGTTTVGATSTTVKGAATTVNGQGTAGTLPNDPSGGAGGDSSGGQLPFTGPPTAAPIVCLCGLVIIFAGTLMRRVVLNVPDTGVSIS